MKAFGGCCPMCCGDIDMLYGGDAACRSCGQEVERRRLWDLDEERDRLRATALHTPGATRSKE